MMNKEIERKFLVTSDEFKKLAEPVLYHQGYLSIEPERVVRIRIQGSDARITIKGKNRDIVRDEFDYPIPLEDARYMLEHLCLQPTIQKFRYKIPYGPFTWEVDLFEGANKGLVIAEIELPDITTDFEKPSWIGDEVSSDIRYYNSSLISYPYNQWE